MASWRVVLQPVSGRTGVMRVVADETTVGVGGHLLLKPEDKSIAAIAPGAWVAVEKEDLTHST